MKTLKWIYVTGVPRSGTTFVGKMLSIPAGADYLHEPFNPRCGMPEIDCPYLYLGRDQRDSTAYEQAIRNLFSDRITLRTGRFKEDTPWRALLKSLVGSSSAWSVRFTRLNPLHRSWIIKDPIGCMLTEFLARNYGVQPVILIRHPAAVVASVMRLGWKMNLDPVIAQRQLIADHFSDDDFLRQYSGARGIEGAAALWRALNTVILRQADRNPDWIVLTHEEICRDPVRVFAELYSTLDLPLSEHVQRKISRFTAGHNPRAATAGSVHSFKRDSRGLLEHSLSLLSRSQRQTILDITRPVAARFYSTESFGLGN